MNAVISNNNTADIAEAIGFISPDVPRDEWVRYGMAIKSRLGDAGFDTFDQWSSAGQTYNPQDTKTTWKSISSDGGITEATLFEAAMKNGYKPSRKGQTHKFVPQPPKPKETPEQAAQRSQEDVDKLVRLRAELKKAKPCKSHQYTDSKGVTPFGALELNGNLILPMRNVKDKNVGAEIITPNGKKRCLPESMKTGSYFVIGKSVDNTVVIVEGYSTGLSLNEATGHCVLVTFGKGNLANVARDIRKVRPKLKIVISPDHDQNQDAINTSIKAARKYGCELAHPESIGDWNDVHQYAGLEEVNRQFENSRRRPEPEPGEPPATKPGTVLRQAKYGEFLPLRLNDAPVVGALMQNPTEDNVALAFCERHAREFIFMHGRGKWFQWDGKRWCEDQLHASAEAVRRLARAYNVKGGASAARHGFVRGCLGFTQSDPVFARLSNDFDNDNYLLNCPDGTWNLLTGERHDHDPGDNITLITTVSPSSEPGRVFLKFLSEIFENDQELIDWLQTALGACLSGAIEDHWILFWIGAGRNGKNTLGDLVAHILGDYAKSIPSDTLMSKKNAEHKTEIANLQGCRLAVASETEEGDFWAESKLKSLTGDAMLSGRYMRQDFIQFRRTHKHLIYGNHRPQLRSLDKAMRSRMKVVPFNVSFDGCEDAMLPEKLLAESSSVLYWLMEGHKQWIKQGRKVGTCEAINHETADYFAMQATIESWIDENCMIVQIDDRPAYQWAKVKDLYSNFKTWCDEGNIGTPSLTRFGEKMKNLGFEKVQSNGYRYKGIEVKF